MRKIQFADNCLYHIYNRGTEKRNIFLDDMDYCRFIHYLYELNNMGYDRNLARKIDEGRTCINGKQRDLRVEIVAFCLMPNHFHLILKQLQENDIIKFMHKLGTAYTMYFNKKNNRNGVLFQGKFKAIPVETDNYLMHLSRYVHFNPIELIEPKWKEEGIRDWEMVKGFLENYRWSSYLDYAGVKNFPSVIDKKMINSLFPKESSYKDFMSSFINSDLGFIKEIILE